MGFGTPTCPPNWENHRTKNILFPTDFSERSAAALPYAAAVAPPMHSWMVDE